MAGPGFMKRQKEIKRQEKAQDKAQRKNERKSSKDDSAESLKAAGLDPDIAHIIPGPQPILE